MSVNLKQIGDGSAGLEGVDGGNGDFIYVNIPYTSASTTVLSASIVPRKCIVHSVTGVTDVVSSNAVTATAYQAASGTALGSGTALHSGTFNLQGTANTNQSLTLSTTAAALSVAAGSRVGVVISGALGAAGNGVITIVLAPA